MNPKTIKLITRGLFIFLIQVLILKRISFSFGDFTYIHIFLYPLVILLYPFNWPRIPLLFLALFYGLAIDMFYDSPGVHASALVLTAYIRNVVLKVIAPYEGYQPESNPTINSMGFLWFLSYLGIMLFVHLLFYFCMESFSLVYIFEITMNTIFSLLASIIISIIYLLVFRPKY
jgi:hypothetical protein